MSASRGASTAAADVSPNSSESTKEYAVVLFPNGEYSEVPTKWIVNANESYSCWWPKDGKCTTAQIKGKEEPDLETWELQDVTVDKFCSTYQSARKRAQDSTFSSTEENQIELGKGKRLRKAKKKYSSGETDDEILESDESGGIRLTAMPDAPDFEKELGKDIESKYKKSKKGGTDALKPISRETCVNSTNHNQEPLDLQMPDIELDEKNIFIETDDDFKREIKSMFQQSKRMWADVKIQQLDIVNRLDYLGRKTSAITNDDLEIIKTFMPLKTVEKIEEFNARLKNEEYESVFKKFIKQIGGGNFKQAVHNSMAKVLRNKCARKYTWKGKNSNKPAAKDLSFIILIRETLCAVHANATEADFDTYASEWFRLSNQRYMRQKQKKNRASQNADEE